MSRKVLILTAGSYRCGTFFFAEEQRMKERTVHTGQL
jgi:hypothetical protein